MNGISSSNDSGNGNAIYLVPMDFMNHWRRFIRQPSVNTLPSDFPSGLSADDALCEHDHVSSPVLKGKAIGSPLLGIGFKSLL